MTEVNEKPRQTGQKKSIILAWFSWHFFEAPKSILKIWRNFLQFNLNYFSIGSLLKTLFSPWKKNEWSYGRGFDIGRYFSVFFSNMISRILGAVVRSFIIAFGLFIEILILFAGAVVFLSWLALPILLTMGFWFGIRILT